MGGLMVLWGWWKIALQVKAEHQRASLTVPQKILTLQLHPYWRFGSDHYNFDANFSVVTTCCLFFCIIEYHSCIHWIPSTESQVEDILHPWRDSWDQLVWRNLIPSTCSVVAGFSELVVLGYHICSRHLHYLHCLLTQWNHYWIWVFWIICQ